MLPRRLYYNLKPIVPASIRLQVRRWFSLPKRERVQDVWPIKAGSETPPAGWPGWPNGKRFAFVLTHDVETQRGLSEIPLLMNLEEQVGFRSSFNLIPEGDYLVPRELRENLESRGFEVGIHDLKHDGKLYNSRTEFSRCADRINQYLKEWNACGFRSGFMHHNLEWLHELNVSYDSSTFDTDPFEPQPDGVHTIFPFWVPGGEGRGYVELPYTLPQDSTVFRLFRDETIDVWKTKLDWVASHGGMVLLDTHPDYMTFGDSKAGGLFPSSMYRDLLKYVHDKYEGQYWAALPREVAGFVRAKCRECPLPAAVQNTFTKAPMKKKPKIWIDLDNTPHVPFFEPIIEKLKLKGYEVLLTARDAFQVCELADQKGLKYLKIGRHHGKNKLLKVVGLFGRALQLAPAAFREKPVLAISHGSRSQIIICNFLRIPTILLADYEYAKTLPLMRPVWEMVPEVVPDSALCCPKERVLKYPGIKEDVYASRLIPDPSLLAQLGISPESLVITARPPATEAHYHNPESEPMFARFMDRACSMDQVRIVLLPRNKKQGELMEKTSPHWFKDNKTVIPKGAVDGLNLVWHSDLIVSGGGTMNREAAALGVPVYSIFRGKIGAVDYFLQREGRLVLIESLGEVDWKIVVKRRKRKPLDAMTSPDALNGIIAHIEAVLSKLKTINMP